MSLNTLKENDKLTVMGVGKEIHRDGRDRSEWQTLDAVRLSPTQTVCVCVCACAHVHVCVCV